MRTNLSHVALATLAAGVLATAACRSDRAAITEPFGSVAFNARLLPAPQGIPGGEVRNVALNGVIFGTTRATVASRVIRLSGLDSLIGTSVYQVFLGNRNATTGAVTYTPATGTIFAVRTDTTFDAAGDPTFSQAVQRSDNASAFQNGGSNVQVFLVIPTTAFGANNLVLVTIEPNAGATTPTLSGPRPLFARGLTATAGATFSFGTYEENPANDRVFVATGRGIARFRDNIILVDDSALVRPPVGYFYETHIVARDNGVIDDEASLNLGAQTAPAPRRNVSLRDADVTLVDPVVLNDRIIAAANRASVDTIASRDGAPAKFPFAGLSEILVTLEAKAGRPEVRSPTIILAGTTPIEVSTPPDSGTTR